MRHQICLHLRHKIHSHNHNDQQAGTAKIERYVKLHYQKLRQQTHCRNVRRTNQRQASHDAVDILRSLLTGTDARHKRPALLQVIRRFLGVEYQGSVEEAEKHDRQCIKRHVQWLAWRQRGPNIL